MNKKITEYFEDLPLWAKVVLLLFLGGVISPIYRILKFLDSKNVVTLVVGILGLVTGVGNLILAVLDIISELTRGRITVFAD